MAGEGEEHSINLPTFLFLRMDVLILRHGKAEKRGEARKDDADRLLTRKGAREIRAVSGWMVANRIAPDVVATSPLKRARETAEIAADGISFRGEISVWDELGPGPGPEAVRERLEALPDAQVILLVGHEPQLSELIALLIGAGGGSRIALGKGGLAKIGGLSPGGGEGGVLEWLITPDQIREMA